MPSYATHAIASNQSAMVAIRTARHCSFVAAWELRLRLPLRLIADLDQQSRPRGVQPSTRLVVREMGSAVVGLGRMPGPSRNLEWPPATSSDPHADDPGQ
jgi:hypothetical protein